MSVHPDVLRHLESFDEQIQKRFFEIRAFIYEMLPQAVEKLGYGVPSYDVNGLNIMYVACFKHHIGLYPGGEYIKANQEKLKAFKTSKETIRVMHNDSIPFDVIKDVITHKGLV